jgi:hypothetical protein
MSAAKWFEAADGRSEPAAAFAVGQCLSRLMERLIRFSRRFRLRCSVLVRWPLCLAISRLSLLCRLASRLSRCEVWRGLSLSFFIPLAIRLCWFASRLLTSFTRGCPGSTTPGPVFCCAVAEPTNSIPPTARTASELPNLTFMAATNPKEGCKLLQDELRKAQLLSSLD